MFYMQTPSKKEPQPIKKEVKCFYGEENMEVLIDESKNIFRITVDGVPLEYGPEHREMVESLYTSMVKEVA